MVKTAKTNGNKLTVSKRREREIGSAKEIVYEISKSAGQLTMNDVKRIRDTIQRKAEAQYDDVLIPMTKVLAGQWMTFTSEDTMNEYFERKVADPSKFYEFEKMHVYVLVE
jgi:hypothetical protein